MEKELKSVKSDYVAKLDPKDTAVKIIMQHGIDHKIPLVGQLENPDDRLYHNANSSKPERKTKELKISFGKLTKQNFE